MRFNFIGTKLEQEVSVVVNLANTTKVVANLVAQE